MINNYLRNEFRNLDSDYFIQNDDFIVSTQSIVNEDHLNQTERSNTHGTFDNMKRKKTNINFAVTNARSLAPKIESLREYIMELDLTFGVLTESWLRDDQSLENTKDDLSLGSRLGLLIRNRKSARGRNAGGGVAVVYDMNRISLKVIPTKRTGVEVLVVSGRILGLSRRLVVIAAYIPPRTRAAGRDNFLKTIKDNIGFIKESMSNPLIVLAGDFSRFDITPAIQDFPDIQVNMSPP